MVEVEAEMEIWWVCNQQIGEDIFEPFQIEGAEGFKELCCQGWLKDIGVDVIPEYEEETLEIVIGCRVFLHYAEVGFLSLLLGKPCEVIDFFLV